METRWKTREADTASQVKDKVGDNTKDKRKTSPARWTRHSRQGGHTKKALRTPTVNCLRKNSQDFSLSERSAIGARDVKASVSGNKASLGSLWPLDLDALVSAWLADAQEHSFSMDLNHTLAACLKMVGLEPCYSFLLVPKKFSGLTRPDSVSSTKAPATARRQSHGRA